MQCESQCFLHILEGIVSAHPVIYVTALHVTHNYHYAQEFELTNAVCYMNVN